MNTKLLLLPSLCLGGTALLLLPLRESEAFSRLGSNLSVNERDMRLFDNFSDASANDNTTAASQFPGQTGAELALWKGIVEWGSQAHGNGSGDTSQATLVTELFERIGRLDMELEWLKKKLAGLG